MKPITEESGEHVAWKAEAAAVTLETLPAFLTKLTTEYQHDYGTICHAIAAGMKATMHAIDSSPAGGITGFQASCIMWQVLRDTFHIEGPARILNYRDLLYPQYADRFTTIDFETWEAVRKIAQGRLLDDGSSMHPEVRQHMQAVAEGDVPFGLRVVKRPA